MQRLLFSFTCWVEGQESVGEAKTFLFRSEITVIRMRCGLLAAATRQRNYSKGKRGSGSWQTSKGISTARQRRD